jgi:hypothetical protein
VRVTVPRKKVSRAGKYFHTDEIKVILGAALAIENTRKVSMATRRWVPWLCAYTGARAGEITQLRGVDVIEQEGVNAIHITPDAGTVKTGRGRTVPLHEHLVAQGFLKYVITGTTSVTLENGVVVAKPNHTIKFINMGNRPVAVSELKMALSQPKDPKFSDDYEACHVQGSFFILDFDVEPFVIQKGEIVIKQLRMTNPDMDLNRRDTWGPSAYNMGKELFLVRGCLMLVTNTATSLSIEYEFPLFEQDVGKVEDTARAHYRPLFLKPNEPSTVIDEWSVRLW